MLGSENRRIIRETQMGAPRIPPTLFDEGAVGLRIVAAMIELGRPVGTKLKSDPIPIRPRGVGPTPPKPKEEREEEEGGDGEDDDVARSESYTCVIEREGGETVRRTVYYDGGDGIGGKFEMNSRVFFEFSPGAAGPIPGDFLSCCFLCRKELHGLDIFMYRGEQPFCSVECRCQQIISDKKKGKFRSKTGKPRSSPPSSSHLSPLPYDAGVAAA